jgi:hypothetical protein
VAQTQQWEMRTVGNIKSHGSRPWGPRELISGFCSPRGGTPGTACCSPLALTLRKESIFHYRCRIGGIRIRIPGQRSGWVPATTAHSTWWTRGFCGKSENLATETFEELVDLGYAGTGLTMQVWHGAGDRIPVPRRAGRRWFVQHHQQPQMAPWQNATFHAHAMRWVHTKKLLHVLEMLTPATIGLVRCVSIRLGPWSGR